MFARLRESRLIASVAALMTGTLIAQAISMAALPLIARIYSPDDFSVLATYVSITAILFTLASLRYDLAIPIPIEKDDAECLLRISVYISTAMSLIIVFFSILIYELMSSERYHSNGQNAIKILPWLPFGVFLCSQNFIFKQWLTREKKFTLIAKYQVVQVSVGIFLQVLLFYSGFGVAGLIIGYVVSVAGAAPILYLKSNQSVFFERKSEKILATLRKYKNYPKYSTWEALFNVGGIELPIFLISIFLAGPEAGYLFIVMRLFGAPVSLLGGAISQVYLASAGGEYEKGTLGEFTKKIILTLLKISIVPLVVIAMIAPNVFEWLLGDGWRRAGEIATWAMPWFLFQLLVSPVSTIFHVSNQQRLALKIQIFGFLLRNGAVVVAILFFNEYVSLIYVVSGAIFYSVYLYFSYKISSLN